MSDQRPPAPATVPQQPEDDGLDTPSATPEEKKPRVARRAVIIAIILAAVAVLLILFAWQLPPFGSTVERTENAYVRGRVTVISPQVSGYMAEVLAKDFESVKVGQPLFRIDDRIHRQRLEQARANLSKAQAELGNTAQIRASRQATVGAREAELASTRAQLDRARADMARVADLASDGSVSVRELDQARAALRAAEAGVHQAEAGSEVARQDVESVAASRLGLEAAVESAQAALRLAEIDLANTVIIAPEAGQLGQVGARRGQYVTAGSQLVSLVPPGLWVIANFKERQAGRIVEGQVATITVDALGDHRFTARVQTISPATGSEFAVLPAQNATGNFTKVAQRLPIRIVLDAGQDGLRRLRPGMSVVAHVDTATAGQERR
ncbi:MAG: HlyD family secretion protein [Lysobacter sp.]